MEDIILQCKYNRETYLAEQVASEKNLPDDLSATDQLCAWKDPKSKCNLAFFACSLEYRFISLYLFPRV
jgi:hypothetical protein